MARFARTARPRRIGPPRMPQRISFRVVVLLGAVVVAGTAALFLRTGSVDTSARAAEIRELVTSQAARNEADARHVQSEGAGLGLAKQRAWFRHAGFGIFIHYGPSSALRARTTSLWWRGINSRKFSATEKKSFRPARGSVESWVLLAKAAGATYLTVTVKHHDGFGLWDSALTDWDVGPRHDLLGQLARTCRREGIKLFLYYSLVDLHEPTFGRNWPAYDQFMRGQLRELLTRYGPIAGMWFDWPQGRSISEWHLERLYGLVHALQPWALIATNHHMRPLRGEDFQIFESAFPGNAGPDGIVAPVSQLPHESAIKLGANWFYGSSPTGYERATISDLLRKAAARNTNLLLDVPPAPDGTFDSRVWTALSGIAAEARDDR
jgi:alpha-L-fucosidase